MKTVQPNCRVLLRFEDEEVSYLVKETSAGGLDLAAISTTSPLGKIILGRKEGEEVVFDNQGLRVWCRIVKIYNPAYNAL